MKIFLTSIGTRGDIEPFLAIGNILSNKGHEITFSFPEQFSNIVTNRYKFYALSPKFIELIQSKEGQTVMGKANIFKKINALFHLYKKGKHLNKELTEQLHSAINAENPDLIIHNAKCSFPLLWSLKFQKPNILLSPVPYFIYPVKQHAHIGFGQNHGEFFNRITYKLANFSLVKTIFDAQKHLPETYNFTKKQIKQALLKRKILFAISKNLFQRTHYWPKHVQVIGYHENNLLKDWQPPIELLNFLNQHSKVLFLTFGSMVNNNPKNNSEILYKAIDSLKIPCIVNTAEGGLLETEAFRNNNRFLFLKFIPYSWIFKKVYAVIHHGGSGTTHMALKYACPSLIIPHIIDQYAWNNLNHKQQLGPKGISIHKINLNILQKRIDDLYNNEIYKLKTDKIARSMAEENSENEVYDFITKETTV